MQNKVLSMLGIAARGRNVVSGEFMTEKAVKSFQINNNLTPDGCVGIATVKKLVK